MMDEQAIQNAGEPKRSCPVCGQALAGAITIETRTSEGFEDVIFGETADRNWIRCDGCALVVCKRCCAEPGTGYCDRCLARRRKRRAGTAIIVFYRSPKA